VKTYQQYFWCHCLEYHEASKQHFLKFGFSPTGSINLGFTIEGRHADVLIIPSSWGSQRAITYKPSSNFSGAITGEEEDFCMGSLSRTIFYFVFVLLYFTFACIFLSKIQKKINSVDSLHSVTLLLVHHVVP
jgi:hypothetical protein